MEISGEDEKRFPICCVDEFVDFFESHVKRAKDEDSEPNLALLSIVLGYLEYRLTLTRNADHCSSTEMDESSAHHNFSGQDSAIENNTSGASLDDFPTLEFNIVEGLYLKFSILLKSVIDRSSTENTTRSGYATRHLCKKVSDVIWNRLNPHYHKDKAHMQSLFSFLFGRQLDCFGLAFVVIAACQGLKYRDVHLALSEDHAWAVHGDNGKEMTEITWHGKGTEDRRGWSLKDTDTEKSWMYLNGNGVICDRMMEVAAMVVAINPSIDSHTDSETMTDVQLKLLKFMHRQGSLDRYPLGLGLLAEMENSEKTHEQAVLCASTFYNGSHVFPYCLQGRYYSRSDDFKTAISCWSKAAQVLSVYNYTREDEEVYREIMDIAKEFIPLAIKSDATICEDENSFLDLIKFYDGICLWEEDSSTPVLHSWWAKYFTNTLGRFSPEVRGAFKHDDRDGNSDSEESGRKHDLRNESMSPSREEENVKPSLLGVRSFKMKGLEDLLVDNKKLNTHTVSLQLTAQSQVHLSRRRLNSGGELTTEYSGRIKKPKKFFE